MFALEPADPVELPIADPACVHIKHQLLVPVPVLTAKLGIFTSLVQLLPSVFADSVKHAESDRGAGLFSKKNRLVHKGGQ